MESSDKSPNHINAVRVTFREGRWVVEVLEPTGASEREFIYERHANAFAVGQRIRLGIDTP